MFFNPKWEVQTKPDVFSLEGLIAWLEQQPASKQYVWAGSNCLICQYLEANGENKYSEYGKFLPQIRGEIVHPMSGPETFGDALERAREILTRTTAAQ